MIDVGARIREFRKQRKLTSKELSNKLGLSPGFVSQIETGQKIPSLETLEQFCIALDVSLSAFFDIFKMSGIGIVCRTFRRYRGITPKELADKLVVSEAFIAQLEEGIFTPSVSTLIEIANILEINIDALHCIMYKTANIHSILKKRQLSIYKLATMTNIDQITLNSIFADYMVPSIDQIQRICDALGISLIEFWGDEKEFNNTQPKNADTELFEILEKQLTFNGISIDEKDKKAIIEFIDFRVYKKIKNE